MCVCVCVCVFSHKKEGNLAICDNMDGSLGYDAKWNVQTEKDKYHMISIICGILKNIIDAENRLVIGRGGVKAVGKMGEGGQKV